LRARATAPPQARGPVRRSPRSTTSRSARRVRAINRQSPYIRARYTSLEQKKEFLDSLIRFEILAKEAYRRGLDKDPEVVRTMKQVMIQKLMREEFDTKVTADTVADDEMKKYYDANLADYVKPEEVRASAIILKNKAQADRVLLEAKGDAGKTNKGFRDLVAKYSSDEETKLRGGDLRYFDAQSKDLPAAVVKATFALVNTGDVSGLSTRATASSISSSRPAAARR
jgi:peptidyl-prolyl cis-trans isomerase C